MIAKTAISPAVRNAPVSAALKSSGEAGRVLAAVCRAALGFGDFIRLQLEVESIDAALADRHGDQPLTNANNGDALLRSERQALHHLHAETRVGRRRLARSGAAALSAMPSSANTNPSGEQDTPITEPKVTR